MSLGRVYLSAQNDGHPYGGRIHLSVVPLLHLDAPVDGNPRLCGTFVRVRNGGAIYQPDGDGLQIAPLGDAEATNGDFLFDPGIGGGRLDKVALADADVRARYIEASRFGEVNTYFHLDRIATYIDGLLKELGAPLLPRVEAVVNAHHAATEIDGMRDGVRRHERWLPFQGGHYRLPSRRYDMAEWAPISPDGEIHLGPGWRLVDRGALVDAAGRNYRANASHNAGILYHEYGHHISRHTADLRGNNLRLPHRQNNRKPPIDEGFCDYWAAALLDTPYIWYWHRQHDADAIHPRSLVSLKTMAEYDFSRSADPHLNGTIWAAALWEMRSRIRALSADQQQGARLADMLVLQALLLLGESAPPHTQVDVKAIRRHRAAFATGLAAMLAADVLRFAGRHSAMIREVFAQRGILPISPEALGLHATTSQGRPAISTPAHPASYQLRHVKEEDIPASEDLLSGEALAQALDERAEPPLSLLVGGDMMLGGRTKPTIAQFGPSYPLGGVTPLIRRAQIAMGNIEGPFARTARKVDRTYSYRVAPALAYAMAQAGITVGVLANNHLVDCGREGILETLDALAQAGIAPVGAARTATEAHQPVICQAGRYRIGILAYYWNRRCAATATLPGCALDLPDDLRADITALRQRVDRVVVIFHWGIPYEREPLSTDMEKAHLAIDCGADVVVGHHPHVIQPIEVYRGRPIIYSVGNFIFGSGNSQAEGMLAGFRFEEANTEIYLYPIYVKNRDARINYQPKLMRGAAARHALERLTARSELAGAHWWIDDLCGRLTLSLATSKEAVATAWLSSEESERGTSHERA